MKIELNQKLIDNLYSRIHPSDCHVFEGREQSDNPNACVSYDVFDVEHKFFFTVKLYFIPNGVVFADCCSMFDEEMCIHIQQALLNHYIVTRETLERRFGEEHLLASGL